MQSTHGRRPLVHALFYLAFCLILAVPRGAHARELTLPLRSGGTISGELVSALPRAASALGVDEQPRGVFKRALGIRAWPFNPWARWGRPCRCEPARARGRFSGTWSR
jgi:hypothetical protein